ncbi:MAG: hypothetical protein CEO12_378 [Parcubacteria group bacterium Gr01-1014_46]|nr:MAG: hypothetical protein CEO12_378 [Parcubacteria group bacterium Gr01-1014_46]
MKKTLIIILALGVCTGLYVYFERDKTRDLSEIKSFEDCTKAGYPVMESYPRRCRTPDGRTFTEEIMPPITYTNATANLIVVDLPFPGAVTGKEFKVMGKARGTWYFEASFPVEVLDKNGKILFQGPAQAKDEWMTENFVPFEITVKVPQSYIGPATLVLRKDNPSGLPEHDASISFPITIEY